MLGYVAHMLYQLWRRAEQAVGAVDLVLEGFEPLVDEAAAARASKQVWGRVGGVGCVCVYGGGGRA